MIASLTKDDVFFLDENNGVYRRMSYSNSKLKRQQLVDEQPAYIVAQIMEVWGDTPTVEDYIPEDFSPSPTQPTTEERITTLSTNLIAAQQTITALDLALIAAEQSITDNDLRLLALEAAA